MNSLRDRLRRLTKSNEDQQTDRLAAASGAAQTDHAAQTDQEEGEWRQLDARICRSEGGAFILRTRRYPLDYRHGRYLLRELNAINNMMAALANVPDQPIANASQLLFFDTETTGLGVGAGNVPFMIGCGYLDGHQFVVEQLFIRNPAEEYYALGYLGSLIERFSHVVTYNGRSFDWPVLKNRFVLHRLRAPGEPAHLDFLYAARSLWNRQLTSCRLSAVEERKLGIVRGYDLPGAEAPERYRQYLITQQAQTMKDVFIHNERDIVSLAVLAVHFQHLLSGTVRMAPDTVPEDDVRVAFWLDKLNLHSRAQEVLCAALQQADKLKREQLLEAAALCKKWHDYDQAAALWRAYCKQSVGTLQALEPLIELAMYYEHRQRDMEAALHWSLQARMLIERRMSLSRRQASDRALLHQIDHRLKRLRRKIDKPAQQMMHFH
mgnify:CR=1 FL=1